MSPQTPLSGGDGDSVRHASDSVRHASDSTVPGRSTVDLKTGELNWQPEEVRKYTIHSALISYAGGSSLGSPPDLCGVELHVERL